MEPTPQCWTCFIDRRWDKDTYEWVKWPPHLEHVRWDENFVHCFTINTVGIQKEIIFDYFEYRYYKGKRGNGTYEGAGLQSFYKRHPYPGKPEAGAYPRWVNCKEPVKEWKPDYSTFAGIIGTGRISE